jgi:hypothetical protein
MKKGDIVKFEGEEEEFAWAAGDMAAWKYLHSSTRKPLPKELTIKQVTPKQYCEGIDDGFEFEEIPGSWKERGFELLQKKEEVNVESLFS